MPSSYWTCPAPCFLAPFPPLILCVMSPFANTVPCSACTLLLAEMVSWVSQTPHSWRSWWPGPSGPCREGPQGLSAWWHSLDHSLDEHWCMAHSAVAVKSGSSADCQVERGSFWTTGVWSLCLQSWECQVNYELMCKKPWESSQLCTLLWSQYPSYVGSIELDTFCDPLVAL